MSVALRWPEDQKLFGVTRRPREHAVFRRFWDGQQQSGVTIGAKLMYPEGNSDVPVEISLHVVGVDATEQSILGLQDWIRKQQIPDVNRIGRTSAPPVAGEMGADFTGILSVVLGSAAIVELAKSVHVWLTVRRPRLKIRLRRGESVVEIDAENMPDQDQFVDRVLKKLNPKG